MMRARRATPAAALPTDSLVTRAFMSGPPPKPIAQAGPTMAGAPFFTRRALSHLWQGAALASPPARTVPAAGPRPLLHEHVQQVGDRLDDARCAVGVALGLLARRHAAQHEDRLH